jgi:hypothetical protein
MLRTGPLAKVVGESGHFACREVFRSSSTD